MRLLVIKAELDPYGERQQNAGSKRPKGELDVVALKRLQHSEIPAAEYSRRMVSLEIDKIRDVHNLDAALRELMRSLPRNWGQVLDMYFGRGVRTRSSGAGIRKRTVENALAGLCRKIEMSTAADSKEAAVESNRADKTVCYDFAAEGAAAVDRIMSYLAEADDVGEDVSASLMMRAVESMKLFRRGQQGIDYSESLTELREKTCTRQGCFSGTSLEAISSCMVIRQEARESQQLSGLERKVREGGSSVLTDRMYEIYSIMTAIRTYLPDKYEKIMSFHWTQKQEKLTELFREMAAMIAASQDRFASGGTII